LLDTIIAYRLIREHESELIAEEGEQAKVEPRAPMAKDTERLVAYLHTKFTAMEGVSERRAQSTSVMQDVNDVCFVVFNSYKSHFSAIVHTRRRV
jgi:hypothetical protein